MDDAERLIGFLEGALRPGRPEAASSGSISSEEDLAGPGPGSVRVALRLGPCSRFSHGHRRRAPTAAGGPPLARTQLPEDAPASPAAGVAPSPSGGAQRRSARTSASVLPASQVAPGASSPPTDGIQAPRGPRRAQARGRAGRGGPASLPPAPVSGTGVKATAGATGRKESDVFNAGQV